MIENINPRWSLWIARTGGGPNHEFMAWIGRHWVEWCALNGRNRYHPKSKQDHVDFDAWLEGRSAP